MQNFLDFVLISIITIVHNPEGTDYVGRHNVRGEIGVVLPEELGRSGNLGPGGTRDVAA